MLKVLKGCKKPTRGTQFSAGIDLYARENIVIGAGETAIVPLGVKIDLKKVIDSTVHLHREYYNRTGNFECFKDWFDNLFMKSHVLKLHIRSSLAVKHGLVIANGTGIIDMDYNKQIGIIIHNPISPKADENMCKIFLMPQEGLNKGMSIDEIQKIQVDFSREHCHELVYIIKAGDKVAQIILEEHKGYLFGIDSEVVRDGGFGSTGKV